MSLEKKQIVKRFKLYMLAQLVAGILLMVVIYTGSNSPLGGFGIIYGLFFGGVFFTLFPFLFFLFTIDPLARKYIWRIIGLSLLLWLSAPMICKFVVRVIDWIN